MAAAAANEEESDDKEVDEEASADTDDDDENEEEINKPSNLELKMIQNSKIGLGSSALAIEFLELINSLCINLLSTNF